MGDELMRIADLGITSLIETLTPIQNEVFRVSGKYWQGIVTHEATPKEGVAADPDLSNRAGGHRTVPVQPSWSEMGIALPALPYSVACHMFEGERPGWTLEVAFELEGQLYTRSVTIRDGKRDDESWSVASLARKESG